MDSASLYRFISTIMARTALIIVAAAVLCATQVVSVRLGAMNEVENLLSQLENSMDNIGNAASPSGPGSGGENAVAIPPVPAGSALQRCRFKCDNLAFLPKMFAGNVSSEHCYLGCMWFQQLGCDPAPPPVPHINQPLLDMIPPKPAPVAAPASTGATGATGATGGARATGPASAAKKIKAAAAAATGAIEAATKKATKSLKQNPKPSAAKKGPK